MLKKDERKKKIKKFKSLASAHIGKIAILLVISTLSSTILCSCGDDKNSTQIETMIEEETEETTTQETSETKTEQTERHNQDADSTEDTAQETAHQSNSTQSSTTQSTTQSTKTTTEQGHVHTGTTETYYTTEIQKVHHDAVTHQETTYTTETQTIETNGYFCDDGAFFESEADAARYANDRLLGWYSGVKRETVTVQVPHTTTVVDKPAWDEKVEVQVPHTRNVCKCGATK